MFLFRVYHATTKSHFSKGACSSYFHKFVWILKIQPPYPTQHPLYLMFSLILPVVAFVLFVCLWLDYQLLCTWREDGTRPVSWSMPATMQISIRLFNILLKWPSIMSLSWNNGFLQWESSELQMIKRKYLGVG